MEVPTVTIEASWSILIGLTALALSAYNTILRRDKNREADAAKIALLAQKVDIIWNLLFPASISHALRAGLLEKNSPLRWSIEALKKHEVFVAAIRTFYEEEGKNLDDLKLLLELSQKFEPEIAKLIAEDQKYRYEAVVLSAFYLCRPEAEIFKKYSFGDNPIPA